MQPDYELEETMRLETPEQYKALGEPLRLQIINLLQERAATTIQLAEALQLPTSTVAHHLQVLVKAGLVKVVRTRQVRAITERYYGNVARSFLGIVSRESEMKGVAREMHGAVLAEVFTAMQEDTQSGLVHTLARVPMKRRREFIERLDALGKEFEQAAEADSDMCAFLGAIYTVRLPQLRQEEESDDTV
ncbi:helix-turn-helix protein [Thermosporothrix hazakensis]|uniref:Helix-turn-helix protein n=2 Tax=Thermosporothrix TaxID=768650 RepID=A0A326U588_THEHA|nr:helix-turn-helix protein [Thermosporothrix hazakensis]